MKHSIVYELERGSLLTLTGMRNRELHVESGQVWLTEAAQPCDHVLKEHQSYRILSTRKLVIEALEPTRVSVPHQSSAGRLTAVRTAVVALWQRAVSGFAGLREQQRRLQFGELGIHKR
jgi:hypothetical protein